MRAAKDGKALYMHYLPTDITGVGHEEGEVEASVSDYYRVELYREASYKPYTIVTMTFSGKVENPQKALTELAGKATSRGVK